MYSKYNREIHLGSLLHSQGLDLKIQGRSLLSSSFLKEAADKDEMYTVKISSVIQSKSGDKVDGLPLITSVKAVR